MIRCDICGEPAKGEIDYEDGEILVGCADCLLKIVADPKKPVESIREYTDEDLKEDEDDCLDNRCDMGLDDECEDREDDGRYESGHRVYRDGSYREDFRSDC